jgi:multiple sugar transport system permease protein
MMKGRITKLQAKRYLSIGLAVIIALIIMFPVYWMFVSSVNDPLAYPPKLLPQTSDLSEYSKAIRDPSMVKWLINTLIVAFSTVALNLIISTPAAYALARINFKGKNAVLLLVLSTQMMSQALLVAPMYAIFSKIGIINTLWCLVLADVALTMPLSTWILMRFFEGIPAEIHEAAMIDGCSRIDAFFRIMLPLSVPGLVTIGVLTFFDAWNEYIFAYTFISQQTNWVASVGLSSFIGQFLISWRSIMVRTLVFILPPVLFYLLLERYVVAGIVEGAVKQ